MTHRSLMGVLVVALAFATVAAPGKVWGQEAAPAQARATPDAPAVPEVGEAKLTTYAEAWVAISTARDEHNALLSESGNKTPETMTEIREQFNEKVATILEEHGLTQEEYERITFIVSVDKAQNAAFNEILAMLEDDAQ